MTKVTPPVSTAHLTARTIKVPTAVDKLAAQLETQGFSKQAARKLALAEIRDKLSKGRRIS